jgi:hypothetical protein
MKDNVNVYFLEFFLEQELFKTKVVEKIKTYIFCSIFFPPEVVSFLWVHVGNYGRAQRVTGDNVIRRRKDAICLQDN